MGKVNKKGSKKGKKEEEPHEEKVVVEDADQETLEDEEIEDPEEWNEEEPAAVVKASEDHQKEFKVLGQQDFQTLSKINVTSSWVENATQFPAELTQGNLSELDSIAGIPSKLYEKIGAEIKQWFPVQKSVIPLLLESILKPPVLRPRDVTISAPTGSGKTLCYVLPSLTMVGECPSGRLSVLILVPVQTLVKQIEEEFRRFNVYDANITALSGGEDFEKEFNKMSLSNGGSSGSDVIIATPGRFLEHLMAPNSPLSLDSLRLLVVDEADRMGLKVRMEWLELIERKAGGLTRAGNLREILSSRHAPRKLLLSATLSKDIEELHMWNLHRPCLFRANVKQSEEVKLSGMDHITGVLALPASISHSLLGAEKAVHPLVIHRRIQESQWQRILIFTNEKASALRLSVLLSILAGEKYKVENLTADLFGRRREKVLRRFKTATTRVLICSDVLSRGVDVPDIDCVVNYDLPTTDRLFVHRAGRTGRAGKEGTLLSVGNKEERRRFTGMLKKAGLWMNGKEELIEEDQLKEHMEEYQEALKELQKKMQKGGDDNSQQKKVSGFEHKRKRKWVPGLKEKRETEKLQKRGIWSTKKKEKKDY